ncbi:Protein of unknown function DUF1075 [Trinorchestia longiramus]|nr:Protein of unknown function DUF1075 [Trinorchestia longiramus]
MTILFDNDDIQRGRLVRAPACCAIMYKYMNVLKNFRSLHSQNGFFHASALRSFSAAGDKKSLDRASTASEDGKSSSSSSNDDFQPTLPTVLLTPSQKRYILLAFKHNSIADVPDKLTVKQVDALYQRARITVNLMVAVVVLFSCIITISLGRRDAAAGNTLCSLVLFRVKQVDALYQRARITVNLMVAVVVLFSCIITISLGRRDAAAGNTVSKQNIDKHKRVRQEYLEEKDKNKAENSEGDAR